MLYDFDKPVNRRNTFATKFAELHEKFGRDDLLPLWIADMDFHTPQVIRQALLQCVAQDVIGYATAPAEFKQAIAAWISRRHGRPATAADIDFLPGVKKGLGLALNYFTRPGDRVVIQPPVYHSFRSVIEGNGRIAVDNPLVLNQQGEYEMNLGQLEQIMADQQPAVMIVCNPHNPVGIPWPAETLRRVAEICHRHNCMIISDEIYADMPLPGYTHTPTASVSSEAESITVTIGAPSKSFNIPGISSAWTCVTNPELRDGFFAWLHASEFDTPPTTAIAATMAAYTQCEEWLNQALTYIQANSDAATAFLTAARPWMRVVKPMAGFGLWIDFRGSGLTHEQIVDRVINRARVAINDGVSFGPGGQGFMRLNLAVQRPTLLEALQRIADAFEA